MLEARFQFRYVTLTDTGGPDTDRRMNTDIFPSEESTISRNSSSRGSYRKVLPSLPDMDQQLNNAAKMIDSRTSTKKGNHSYKPYFLEYTLLAEYNLLQKQRVAGVYVIPSANSPMVWFGVIFIRQGLYQGGIFRFALHIPENYPDGDVPSVFFETPVFHPLVDPETGELEVKKGFSNKWRRNVHHLWHVLLYLRRIFYKIETVNPLNPEAAVLYESDQSLFESRVSSCVKNSQDQKFEPPKMGDPHAIVFSPYDPAKHDSVREELKSAQKELMIPEDTPKGLSWIQGGTLNIFSKEAS
ncbi:UNVERIFIED_CONTAM: hypothetical protein RMT77_015703 [Armadillidium vulgare]